MQCLESQGVFGLAKATSITEGAGKGSPEARAQDSRSAVKASSGWKRRKDFRQPEILAAARLLMEAEGAAGVTISKIAAKARVSEATIYKYFNGKQDVINQVLIDWAGPNVAKLKAELAQIKELRSRLVIVAIRFLRSMEETPSIHRVFFQEIRWSEYKLTLHDLNRDYVKTVTGSIEDGIKSGEIRPEVDPKSFRDMLFGGLEHMAMRTSFSGKPVDIETAAANYVDMMLQGAVPRSGSNRPQEEECRRFSALIDLMETRLKGA